MTYFTDSLETSFKYLAGCHQTTIGKSYDLARLFLLDTVFIVDVGHVYLVILLNVVEG